MSLDALASQSDALYKPLSPRFDGIVMLSPQIYKYQVFPK